MCYSLCVIWLSFVASFFLYFVYFAIQQVSVSLDILYVQHCLTIKTIQLQLEIIQSAGTVAIDSFVSREHRWRKHMRYACVCVCICLSKNTYTHTNDRQTDRKRGKMKQSSRYISIQRNRKLAPCSLRLYICSFVHSYLRWITPWHVQKSTQQQHLLEVQYICT